MVVPVIFLIEIRCNAGISPPFWTNSSLSCCAWGRPSATCRQEGIKSRANVFHWTKSVSHSNYNKFGQTRKIGQFYLDIFFACANWRFGARLPVELAKSARGSTRGLTVGRMPKKTSSRPPHSDVKCLSSCLSRCQFLLVDPSVFLNLHLCCLISTLRCSISAWCCRCADRWQSQVPGHFRMDMGPEHGWTSEVFFLWGKAKSE